MLGFIKSVGSKAISSLPGFNSRTKITAPQDPNLQDKLKEISSQILRAQASEQFKVYQQLQSVENADFNRNLRKIYEHEGCTTETINCIIRFYTFLLTNCKNQLVVCKLVSQPLVIELTKIVLQIKQTKQSEEQLDQMVTSDCLQGIQIAQSKEKPQSDLIDLQYETRAKKLSLCQSQESQQANNNEPQQPQRKISTNSKEQNIIKSLHYLNEIDWDEVNAYKVALIRSYINCINPETIKYMIIYSQLPIFVNCVNGYKHYLSEGVEGTCLSNCILTILTKVNHNDEVCEIIFDQQHHYKAAEVSLATDSQRQTLTKSISTEKSIKLHEFVKEVIKKISVQISTVLQNLSQERQKQPTNDTGNDYGFVSNALKQYRKLDLSMEFVQSNILFCVDLINSINNYNYTAKIKENIGESIEKQLIGRIVAYVERQNAENTYLVQKSTPFQLTILKLVRFVLNLSITCQKESMMIEFLNKYSPVILETLIRLNKAVFGIQQDKAKEEETPLQANSTAIESPSSIQQSPSSIYSKQCLTYLCNFCLILLKQTISPYSKLASRKRLQISNSIIELKESILSKIFTLLQQVTKSQPLKQGVCFKSIRNLLLCIFYLTIKEDKCSVVSTSPQKRAKVLRPQETEIQFQSLASQKVAQKANIGLILQFKYSVLLLHKIYCDQFKKIFADNKNWQFIVNNYESLMRQVPNTILSAQENDKFCHFHNNHSYQDEDRLRDRILICQAVRNYRYMIIHETKLESKLIRLENIYHKHFMSPGWNYYPGEIVQFTSSEEYKVVCCGFLHNNNLHRLPIEIIQDFECLLICHRVSENNYRMIANIRYKKIHSFVPEGKNLIRMKLIGIQELILEFSTPKILTTFKEYLNENRNKTREKELKFINYYLNMYMKDSERLIEQIYNQDLVGIENNVDEKVNYRKENQEVIYGQKDTSNKKFSLDKIQVDNFEPLKEDFIPQSNHFCVNDQIQQNQTQSDSETKSQI